MDFQNGYVRLNWVCGSNGEELRLDQKFLPVNEVQGTGKKKTKLTNMDFMRSGTGS